MSSSSADSIGGPRPIDGRHAATPPETRERLRKTIHRAFLAKGRVKELPERERSSLIRSIGHLLEKDRESLTDQLVREGGQVRKFVSLEFDLTIRMARNFDSIISIIRNQELPSDSGRNYIVFEPFGVVGIVAPRNAPLFAPYYAAFCSFGGGNSTVVKPSSGAPLAIGRLVDYAKTVGFPEGAMAATTCPGEEVAREFVENPEVDVFVIFSSSPVGKDNIIKMGEYLSSTKHAAGRRLVSVEGRMKKYVPELAGNDPFIALKNTDLERAVDAATLGGFANAGQLCFSSKRFLVHRSLAERFRQRLCEKVSQLKVGDPNLPDTDIGPLGREGAASMALEVMKDAEEKGGKILTGGRCDGQLFYPTVIEFDKNWLMSRGKDSRPTLWAEESFAPIRSLVVFDTEDEAVCLANDGPYGLGASIFGDTDAARRVAARLDTGRVIINESPLYADFNLPVGGIKDSGLYGSTHKIQEVVYAKRIHEGLQSGTFDS